MDYAFFETHLKAKCSLGNGTGMVKDFYGLPDQLVGLGVYLKQDEAVVGVGTDA